MGQFSDAIDAFIVKVEQKSDRFCSSVALELLNRIVERSPVGNPDLWAANENRNLWNKGAADVNAELRLNPANLTRAGRLRRGLKVQSKTLYRPDGYVGGRFRGNWQVTVGSQPTTPVDLIDANGGKTRARGQAALAGFKAGPAIYITNNVPYAIPLEFGHSSQAPAGVLRITVAEFTEIVNKVAQELSE